MKRETWSGIGGVLLFLALWQSLVATKVLDYDYLPAPSLIAGALVTLLKDGEIFGELIHTLSAALMGWLVSVVLGISIGACLGLSPTMRRYSLASIEMMRPLPGIAFVPVAILLFGFSLETELLVIVIPTVWPVLINTMGGLAMVHARLHDVVRSLRLPPVAATVKVFAPAAAAPILVGCRLALTLALIMSIAAEMIGNPTGLGYAVVREAAALHPDSMFAYIFVIGLLGVLLNALLLVIAKLLLPGEFRRPRAEWSAVP
jgi:sulfonate transport system permease protein